MKNITGHAGKSTREMAKKRRQSALWIGLIGIVLLVIIYLIIQNSTALGIGGIVILVLLILFRILPDLIEGRVNRKIKEEKRAIRGAKAEEKVGELLEDLSEEYYVLNDVESPYGNIDHIVIGINNGVFLIETKAHGGKVEVQGETLFVNGKVPEKNFISQALKNSYWLRDEIGKVIGSKPWITAIIVFTNAFVSPTKPIKGVNIVNKKYLPNILHRISKPNLINAQIWEHREEIRNNLRGSK
jgi:hypothetical protein